MGGGLLGEFGVELPHEEEGGVVGWGGMVAMHMFDYNVL